MTSTAVAGIATAMLFSTVAALALSGPSSKSARLAQQHHRLAIAERLAPAPIAAPDVPEKIVVSAPSVYAREQKMSVAELMKRWEPLIKKASNRFKIPADWIREVVRLESGGRTMLAENMPMVSNRGALGLMQLLPATYTDMRAQYGLGADPFNPRDNIFAGAAYLKWLHGKYGYPAMFTAYNDGPGNYEQRTAKGSQFPAETQNYLTNATLVLGGPHTSATPAVAQATPISARAIDISALVNTAPAPTGVVTPAVDVVSPAGAATPVSTTPSAGIPAIKVASITPSAPVAPSAAGVRQASSGASCVFTKADGSPLAIDCGDVSSIREPLKGECLPGIQAVLSVGVTLQTVRESVALVRRTVLAHGGHV
jgi:hypothetical protein